VRQLLQGRTTGPAWALYRCARDEAAALSFAVGVEHLLLATVVIGDVLEPYGVDADDVRDLIVARERDALASLGISLDSVRGELAERLDDGDRCELPVSPEVKRLVALAARRRRHVTPEQLLATLVEHSVSARRLLAELGVPLRR
jgi:Clp amino terminal domain, pathogenicity island component